MIEYVGIDIGGTNIRVAGIDKNNNIVSFNSVKTMENVKSAEDLYYRIKELIERITSFQKIKGIGIGCPGAIDENGNITTCRNVPYLKEYPLVERLKKDFDVESLKSKLAKVVANDKQDLVKTVTCKEKYSLNENGKKQKIAIIDYGCPKSFIDTFTSQDYKVTVFPATATADEILKEDPKGIFLSSGPGYAANSSYAVDAVKQIIQKCPDMPVFAIAFGSQVLALANGAKVVKHKIGHRGANYPVRDINTNKIAITSQDNGYYTDKSSIEQNENLQVTHINLYDGTVAGFANKKGNNFAVEFYPSLDSDETGYLFKNFFDMVEKNA